MAEYSEEEHEIDIESDDDDERYTAGGLAFQTEADKKAHHNALERKRRDQIKESFNRLRDVISQGKEEKMSRAQILQKATKYIHFMINKSQNGQKEIDTLKRKINILKQQEKICATRENGEGSEQSDTSEDNLDYFFQNNEDEINAKRSKSID